MTVPSTLRTEKSPSSSSIATGIQLQLQMVYDYPEHPGRFNPHVPPKKRNWRERFRQRSGLLGLYRVVQVTTAAVSQGRRMIQGALDHQNRLPIDMGGFLNN